MRTLIAIGLVCSGCAALTFTPAQERTMAHYESCKQEVGARTTRITELRADGSFRYEASAVGGELLNMSQCLTRLGHKMQLTDPEGYAQSRGKR